MRQCFLFAAALFVLSTPVAADLAAVAHHRCGGQPGSVRGVAAGTTTTALTGVSNDGDGRAATGTAETGVNDAGDGAAASDPRAVNDAVGRRAEPVCGARGRAFPAAARRRWRGDAGAWRQAAQTAQAGCGATTATVAQRCAGQQWRRRLAAAEPARAAELARCTP